MSPAPTKTHSALLVPAAEAGTALASIREFSDRPSKRHQLPGAIQDLIKAATQMLDTAAQIDPDILHAIERGLRSTRQLQEAESELVARFRAEEGRL